MKSEEFRKLPAVDKLLLNDKITNLVEKYGKEPVTKIIQKQLAIYREMIKEGGFAPSQDSVIDDINKDLSVSVDSTLKPVINATGIVLHTNLSRAPLGNAVLRELTPIIQGYSNLEFDLVKGRRGQRNTHISDLIKMVTGAEDAVVVNNNAAAVMLTLKTFAEGREVIISRGELIEIGGSFRIPDIMKASGAKMIEVGTTNRTRLEDYESAITNNTAMIFKAHKSNYKIKGFTEEAALKDLAELAAQHNLISVYDLGSGLLKQPRTLDLHQEPDVKSCLEAGIDIISFSGDKLLGGPQAGIILGKKDYVSKIAKAPMMRALRVGKLTIAALRAVISWYMSDEKLIENVPIFSMLNRDSDKLKHMAESLKSALKSVNIESDIIPSEAQVGGGTLPDLYLKSYAVKIHSDSIGNHTAENIFKKLMLLDRPVVSILREGNLMFDVQSIFEWQIESLAQSISQVVNSM